MALLAATLKNDPSTYDAQVQSQSLQGGHVSLLWSIAASNISEAKKRLEPHLVSNVSINIEDCTMISIIGCGFWQNPEFAKDISKIITGHLFFEVKDDIATIVLQPSKGLDSIKKVISDLNSRLMEEKL
ncbi:MAG: hypothetical protein NT027_05690 [Proteobacteria bacterium]|nr:hypothetical protein [Pseudomonadota bacterium]